MNRYNAFTLKKDTLLRVLDTDCQISQAISLRELESGIKHPPLFHFRAVWDTGASASAISENVVKTLGLIPTGKGISNTAAGSVEVNTYFINILLPNHVAFSTILVSCNNMNVDVLIGMDIISKGDFCLTNKDGKTCFSFQVPASHFVDYVEEINTIGKKHNIWVNKGIHKCPCGSGKMWKNCHGLTEK